MVSFGIGLALLVLGYTLYALATVIVTPLGEAGGVLAPAALQAIVKLTNIPDSIVPYLPYVGLGIMVIGVGWYWVLGPVLYLTRPREKY